MSRTNSVMAVLVFVIAIELLAWRLGGVVSAVACVGWLIGALICVSNILNSSVAQFISELKERSYVLILVVCITSGLIFWGGWEMRNMNGESVQQVSESLNLIKRIDFGYFETAFLGYPARQYLLVSWPSLLLGRSSFAIAFGYGFWLFVGIIAFYLFGVRMVGHRLVAGAMSLSLFGTSFLALYSRVYEQSILPVSFTMIGLYCLSCWFENKTVINGLGLLWILSLLAYSYTPSLSILGFFLLILIYRLIIYSSDRWLGVGMVIGILGFLIPSLLIREDLFRNPDTVFLMEGGWQRVIEAALSLSVFSKDSFWGWGLGLVVMFMIFYSLLRPNRYRLVILAWMSLTFLFSVSMKGYAQPGAIDSMHRSMVVVPVVVAWIGYEVRRLKGFQRVGHKLGATMFLLMTVTAVYRVNSFDRSNRFTNHPSIGLVKDILDFNVEVVSVQAQSLDMAVAGHYLKYFRPDTLFYWEPGCSQRRLGKGLVYTDNESCEPVGGVNSGKLTLDHSSGETTLVRYLVEGL